MVKLSSDFILLLMIFMHVVDDYRMQGILSSLKQKVWWQQNYPAPMYRFDYLCALLIHSFSWTFMIMLPVAYYSDFKLSIAFKVCFAFNVLFHVFIDDAKANKLAINLIVDQFTHIVQILITFIICVLCK